MTKRKHVPVFPASSVDEQLTIVCPTKNVSFDVWEQVTFRSVSTLSEAVALSTTMEELFSPESVSEVAFAQIKVGASSSARQSTSIFDSIYNSYIHFEVEIMY